MLIVRQKRVVLLASLAILFLAPIHCRNAEGVSEDPIDHEAENALVEYLAIDTSNPPGHETLAAQYLQRLLAKEGIAATLVGSDPQRQSVYARLSSGTGEKALILMHHLDVVPADPSEWTKKPFGGSKSGGYIFGRGALDIKSLGIANLMAFIDLKRRKVPLRRDVIFLGVADEEAGGLHGCKELLEKHPELFAGAGFVLNEGGYNETIVDKVSFWGIEVAQKVPLWMRLTSRGMPGHSASPPDDGGSIARLVDALGSVNEIPRPYRLTPAVVRYFKAVGAARTDARGEVMRGIEIAIHTDRVEKVLSANYRSLLRDTIAFTRISGGTSINSIPARATADLDIRLLPDEAAEDMIARVTKAAGDDAAVEVVLKGEPSPESPSDTELFRLLEKTFKAAEPGSSVAATVGAGTSDSRYFRAHGFVAYGIAPFKVNYYDADTVHGADERIRARFFSEGVRLMRTLVNDFCAKQ
jgi:acetylornithine deacetylase/succinyl-diaminopimelate desuccinylase-like protein